MPIEDRHQAFAPSTIGPWAVHATAVAIDGLALLIRGASKSGKSSLALDLVATSAPECPILLIGDDRILLTLEGDDVIAKPHPLIEGRIEKRGYGILSMPFTPEAAVAGIVDLGENRACDLLGKNFPSLLFVNERRWMERCTCARAWFAATSTAHMAAKRRRDAGNRAKDSNW